MTKKPRLKLWANASDVHLVNKRILLYETEKGDVIITYIMIDHKNADKPAAVHKSYRGKVRSTSIRLSKESLEATISAYVQLQNHKKNIQCKKQ